MRPQTIIVDAGNGPVMINATDYNSELHTIVNAADIPLPVASGQPEGLVPAAPVAFDANGNPVNAGDGGAFVPAAEGGELRQDGPTVEEYVAAGYAASSYPPQGYASRSTQEEIDAAVAAQKSHDDGDKKPAPTLLVTKNDKKKFVVVDLEQKPYAADDIDENGYKTEKEAWEAVNAHVAKLTA